MRNINKEIDDKLKEIEKKENVRVLYAVESGSRAWGVESPDSDYDVRFIYVRKKKDYLSVEEKRDIIEWQLDEVLDINGWDLKKTLVQFHKGNATLFEWANSPVVYKTTDEWKEIYESCKKYVYALRPLLACKYIEDNDSIPPVKFEDLMKQTLPDALSEEISKMLEIKAKSDEKELNVQMPLIQKYIKDEIVKYEKMSKELKDDRVSEWETINEVFLRVLEE